MNTRAAKLVLLVILLTLTGCQRPAGNDAVSTSVAATLISMEEVDAVEPTLPVVPSATPWVEDPTE